MARLQTRQNQSLLPEVLQQDVCLFWVVTWLQGRSIVQCCVLCLVIECCMSRPADPYIDNDNAFDSVLRSIISHVHLLKHLTYWPYTMLCNTCPLYICRKHCRHIEPVMATRYQEVDVNITIVTSILVNAIQHMTIVRQTATRRDDRLPA